MATYKFERWTTENGHEMTIMTRENPLKGLLGKAKEAKKGFDEKHPKLAKAGKTAGKVALVGAGAAAAVAAMKATETPKYKPLPEAPEEVPETEPQVVTASEPETETPFEE